MNDTRGHASGDIYLRAIGERLLGACRKEDTLARWGGDEFVMVLEDIAGHGAIVSAMTRLQRQIFALHLQSG